MSTRANIIIKDSDEKLFFYRHSDGYPSGTLPTLNLFLDWVRTGEIRDNVGQAAGWLIMLGAIEYNTIPTFELTGEPDDTYRYAKISSIAKPGNWKVGAYEPTTGIHEDIEYLYVLDLDKKSIKVYDSWDDQGNGKTQVLKKDYR